MSTQASSLRFPEGGKVSIDELGYVLSVMPNLVDLEVEEIIAVRSNIE
jgi:hypothetical protein